MFPPIVCLPGPTALQTSLFLSLGAKMTLDEEGYQEFHGEGLVPGLGALDGSLSPW